MLFRRSGSYVSIGAAAAVVLANGTIGEGDRKRMKNGVVCWFEQADQRALAESVQKTVYGDKELDEWDKLFERKYQMMMDVNCDEKPVSPAQPTPEWHCSCNQTRIATYCAALKFRNQIVEEGFQKGVCRDEAFETLNAAQEFGKYVHARLKKEHDDFGVADSVERITNESAVERAQLFCESIESTVWNALKTYFESDLFGEIRGEGSMEKQIEKVCNKSTVFKASKMGECMCNKADSFAVRGYCEIRAIANVFVDKGFLNCDTKSFDNSKKPEDKNGALCIAITGSNCEQKNHCGGQWFKGEKEEETTTMSAAAPTLLLAAALVVLLQG
ncbi:hypothetical protein PRIPAC_93399 [Pristionchus pacificus]|uniref:Uncharacterized protein n=1 Tax=Pristionchus pacificus TaxID=54126 RepID=A0A2A6BIF4_PRIPA|nr:hypothetical protein PRIPAC_93399 [Pristionchus pacificus]|eukprot:PDM65667.1 hypothetical protein PRIPAC_45581 [Pristionchus pacificus]